MDSELLDNSLSDDSNINGGSERDNRFASSLTYAQIFEDKFPYYLSIGMTEEQYWDKDSQLAKYYRKAEELRKERMNEEAWLQGMYVYDALIRISPILRAFAKKSAKPEEYVEEPYPITEKKIEEVKIKKEEANKQKAMRYMQAYMVGNNKRFKDGGELNVHNNRKS